MNTQTIDIDGFEIEIASELYCDGGGGAYAWRSLLQTGVHLPLSSDFPGETLNPFYGIYAAITRQDPQGDPPGGWYSEQRLTLEEALRGYTVEAAYAEFEEQAKGSIEPGKLADFIVISGNITSLPAKEILNDPRAQNIRRREVGLRR